MAKIIQISGVGDCVFALLDNSEIWQMSYGGLGRVEWERMPPCPGVSRSPRGGKAGEVPTAGGR